MVFVVFFYDTRVVFYDFGWVSGVGCKRNSGFGGSEVSS